MKQERVVLCGASSYEEKYYLNSDFQALPEEIKKELQILCVLYTNDVGGIFLMEFDEDGNLQLKTEASEGDYTYDEIGSVLKIKEIQNTKSDLLRSLELFYRVVFLGESYEEQENE